MYAGYRMWKNGDYGCESGASAAGKAAGYAARAGRQTLGSSAQGIFFKGEAYLGGRDWLEHNDGGRQRLVFRMRLATAVLAIALSLVIFFAAREWFGTMAALVALTLAVFDPNFLAHSGLVTLTSGPRCFSWRQSNAFYRYVKRPALLRLLIAGVVTGLLLATKHSGILIVPILLLLIGWEIAFAPKGETAAAGTAAGRGFAVIAVVGIRVLWAFYGFRYAARPAGLQLIPTLSDYSQSLTPFQKGDDLVDRPPASAAGVLPLRDGGYSGLCQGLLHLHLGQLVSARGVVVFSGGPDDEDDAGTAGTVGAGSVCHRHWQAGQMAGSGTHSPRSSYVLCPAPVPGGSNVNGLNIGVRHISALVPAGRDSGRGRRGGAGNPVPRLDVGLHGAHCGAYRLGAERLPKFACLCQRGLGRGLEHPQNSQ